MSMNFRQVGTSVPIVVSQWKLRLSTAAKNAKNTVLCYTCGIKTWCTKWAHELGMRLQAWEPQGLRPEVVSIPLVFCVYCHNCRTFSDTRGITGNDCPHCRESFTLIPVSRILNLHPKGKVEKFTISEFAEVVHAPGT